MPTVVGSAAELLVATGHDPFVRGTLRRPVARGWVGEGVVAWLGVDAEERTGYLHVLGPAPAAGAMVAELLPELPPLQRVTLPRGTGAHLPAWVGLDGMDWDFRWTDTPVPAGSEPVEEVTDLPALKALLAEANPEASVQPGDPAARRWVGVMGAEGLLACAADTTAATAVGHLSAVAVHPDARGRGFGSAVTAALTNALLAEGCDVVTLGLYSSNTAARRLYDALGFADTHRFTSGRLTVRDRW